MDIGEWFYVKDFGSNSRSRETFFNGFTVKNNAVYYWQEI